MPSNQAKKGTNAVRQAIESLRHSRSFDFRLLDGVARPDGMKMMRNCDIFLDQFVLGDHGLAALEAMALGKPCVCYIKPSVLREHPRELPIVVANQDNLAEVIGNLLDNGDKRNELGRLGRAYVEKYHDALQIAEQLVEIYQRLIATHRSNRP
jgi:glycosyltransferase involved in cell wall biosynthesis